mgnify:CR=1 FL=1
MDRTPTCRRRKAKQAQVNYYIKKKKGEVVDMEKHFNIFQSYNSGNEKDIESVVQLEDNITRAFLCTLSNIEKSLQQKIVKNLLKLSNIQKAEEFKYDLQNPSSLIDFREKNKILEIGSAHV